MLHEWNKGRKSKWFPFFSMLTHPDNTRAPFTTSSASNSTTEEIVAVADEDDDVDAIMSEPTEEKTSSADQIQDDDEKQQQHDDADEAENAEEQAPFCSVTAPPVLGSGVLTTAEHRALFSLPPVCALVKPAVDGDSDNAEAESEDDSAGDEITVQFKVCIPSADGSIDFLGDDDTLTDKDMDAAEMEPELVAITNIHLSSAASAGDDAAAECPYSFAPAVSRLDTFHEYYSDMYVQIVSKLLTAMPAAFPVDVYSEENFVRAMHVVEALSVTVRIDTPSNTPASASGPAAKKAAAAKESAGSLFVIPVPFRLPAAHSATEVSCLALCNSSAQTYAVTRYKTFAYDNEPTNQSGMYIGLHVSGEGMTPCGFMLYKQPLHILLETPLLSYTPAATHLDEPNKAFTDLLPVSPDNSQVVVGSEAHAGADFVHLQWWASTLHRLRSDPAALVDALYQPLKAVDEEVELSAPMVHSTDDLALRLGGRSIAEQAEPLKAVSLVVDGQMQARVEYWVNPLQALSLASEFILDLLYHAPAAVLPPVLASVFAGYSKEIIINTIQSQLGSQTVHLPCEGGRRVDLACYGDKIAAACRKLGGSESFAVVQLLPLPLLNILQKTCRVAVTITANDEDDMGNTGADAEADKQDNDVPAAARLSPTGLEDILEAIYEEVDVNAASSDALVLAWAAESMRWNAAVEYVLKSRAAQHVCKLVSLCEKYPSLNTMPRTDDEDQQDLAGPESVVLAAVDYHAQQLHAISIWTQH